MIYAIAMTNKKLAHRFSQAELFTFYNEQQEVIAVYKNPALGISGCAAKKQIVALLQKMACDVVIVRKIGERTLARLLRAGFTIEQGNTRYSVQQNLENARLQKHPLTSPEQGVQKQTTNCAHH